MLLHVFHLAQQDNSPLQKEPAPIHINNVKLALEPQPYSILTPLLVWHLALQDKSLYLREQVQILINNVKLVQEAQLL